ncbi:MAG: energy-coupling factor transporter transmembrane protein EcfT [Chloroflexia bacterium]|nr:energy-coupling factor transporter transmembrane protein EcfT [Chloroflexia bacterium]
MSVANAAFDFYSAGRSWLHQLDPRVKLAIVAACSTVLLLWLNLILLAGGIIAIHLILLLAGYPWTKLRAVWRALLPLLVLVVLLWPVFYQAGATIFRAGPLTVTSGALGVGAATALRITAVSFVFLLWIGTTDTRELVRGFVRLGLPFSWGMSLTIGLRFIPTFAGIFVTVSDAQQSRGLILHGNVFRRARQMIPILVASLVSAFRASEQLAMTLESRGFGASRRRTVLRDLRMRPVDWIVLTATLVAALVLAYLALFHGFGRGLY